MLHREHAGTTENDAFELIFTRLVLENSDFIGDRELDKAFFVSNQNLHIYNMNNSLKLSLFSNNLKSTTNQSLNEIHYCATKK